MKKHLILLAAAALALAACGEKVVPQPDTPELTVTPTEINAPAAGTTASLQITSNTKWAVSTTDAWITIEPANGEGNGTVTVTVAENTAYKARTGKLSVNSTAKRQSIEVKQEAAEKPVSTKITEIKTAEDFASFGDSMDQYEPTEVVKLAANITVTEPVNELNCIFDGQGYTITLNYEDKDAITAEAPEMVDMGVFRKVSTTVKNLKTAGSIKALQEGTEATIHAGGIAGYATGTATIENCTNGIAISASNFNTHHLGGICGFIEPGATLTGCKNTARIEAAYEGSAKGSQVGGILGHLESAVKVTNPDNTISYEGKPSLIENCTNDGEVVYTGAGTARMGGICGYVNNLTEVTFKNCTNNGQVLTVTTGYSGTSWVYIGGVSGYYGTPVRGGHALYEGCINNGAVTCDVAGTKIRARVAGINCHAGNSGDTANDDGTGIYTWELRNCTNNGNLTLKNCVSATRAQVGGIQAYGEPSGQVIISGCTSNGKLYSDNQQGEGKWNAVGGLLGGNAAVNSEFTNNTVTANVVLQATLASADVGLICGTNNPYTTAISGKVGAATIIKGDATTVATADNFSGLLFGKELGAGSTITGVTFGE